MSQSIPESLPSDLLRLLESERSRPDPPEAMRSLVFERISKDLLDLSLVDEPGIPGGPTKGGAVPASPTLAKLALARRLPRALALLVVGGAVGAGLHAVLREPAVRVVSTVPAAATPAQQAAPATELPATKIEPTASKERARIVPSTRFRRQGAGPAAPVAAYVERQNDLDRAAQREPDQLLAAERALLEEARTALARGNAREALSLLARSRQEFPNGTLIEEREALVILALSADGQMATATAAAGTFRKKYPKSMLLPSIEAALSPTP